MMPVVRVNDATFGDLKTIAAWFGTRTPSETIDRIVREAMEQLGLERDDEPANVAVRASDGAMEFAVAPSLTFTKPLAATVDGKAIAGPTWSAILLRVIARVKAKGPEGEKLVRELHVPAKVAAHDGDGFRHHPDLGISVQGQSAAAAWEEVERLARKWRIPVAVEFMWRPNPKAQFPGRKGVLRSGNA